MKKPHLLVLLAALAVSACGERDIRLHNFASNTGGPDEFSVLPSKALETPGDYQTLPTPTPGQANLTDQQPQNDAYVALGGRAQQRPTGQGIGAGDAALVQHANRHGASDGIRETLSEEDLEFRKRKSRFTRIRLVREDRYNLAYRRQTLDPFAETERWRRAGVQTPTSPPQ